METRTFKVDIIYHLPLKGLYISLTNFVFSVRTVSYGPSFFPPRFMARALRAWAINRRGKNEGP